jgi:hypothetical protein
MSREISEELAAAKWDNAPDESTSAATIAGHNREIAWNKFDAE